MLRNLPLIRRFLHSLTFGRNDRWFNMRLLRYFFSRNDCCNISHLERGLQYTFLLSHWIPACAGTTVFGVNECTFCGHCEPQAWQSEACFKLRRLPRSFLPRYDTWFVIPSTAEGSPKAGSVVVIMSVIVQITE